MSSKLPFRSRLSAPFADCFTSSGSTIAEQYVDCLDEYGVPTVKVSGEYDIQEFINASFEQCYIYNILEKAATDPTVLQQVRGSFINISDAPKSLAEALQRKMDMEDSFKKLPASVRALFDNNLYNLLDSLNNGTAEGKISNFIEKFTPDVFRKSEKKEGNVNE